VIAGSPDGALACAGGFGFEVRDPSGVLSTYGCERDATVFNHLGAHTWALARVEDRFGNDVDYRYAAETADVVDGDDQWIGEADVDHLLVDLHRDALGRVYRRDDAGPMPPTASSRSSSTPAPTTHYEAHIDHIYPQSKGGEGSPSNGQVLCPKCNSAKGDSL